jgi:hypothetical protein
MRGDDLLLFPVDHEPADEDEEPAEAPGLPISSITWPAYELGPTLAMWRGRRFSAEEMADVLDLHVDHYRDIERRRQPPPTTANGDYERMATFIATHDDEWGADAIRERLRILDALRERDRRLWRGLPKAFWAQLAAHSTISTRR